MKNIFLSQKRKDRLIAFSYELSKMIIAGMAIAGFMDGSKVYEMVWGVVLAILFFLFGFLLESNNEDDGDSLP